MYWRNKTTGHLSPPIWNILGWNCLGFVSRSVFHWPGLQQTQRIKDHCHLSWFWNPPVSFCDVLAFHGDQIVGWVATTLYESRILEFYNRVSRSSWISSCFSDKCLALFGRLPWPAKQSCFAFPSSTCLEELNSLTRTMDRLYPLFFKCLSCDAIRHLKQQTFSVATATWRPIRNWG